MSLLNNFTNLLSQVNTIINENSIINIINEMEEKLNKLELENTKLKEDINVINKELIHFSKYDCDRSIPNLMDGLKVSQRKILFSSFEKNLMNEIKVAQFSGYVSEHSGYHHG